jgi:hypothetical protein
MKYFQTFLNGLSNSMLFLILLSIWAVSLIATSNLSVRPIENATNVLGKSIEKVQIESISEPYEGMGEYTIEYQESNLYDVSSYYSPDGLISRIKFHYPEFISEINPMIQISNTSQVQRDYSLLVKLTSDVDMGSIVILVNETEVSVELDENNEYSSHFKLNSKQSLDLGLRIVGMYGQSVPLQVEIHPIGL